MIELNEEILKTVIRKRPRKSHKGTFGRVVIIGGNEQYGGAAILSSSAAVYAGAGLVTVACDLCNHASLHSRLPEAMVIDFNKLYQVQKAIKVADVIVIGCGLGLDRLDLLKLVLTELSAKQKLVIDGSAITLFAQTQWSLNFPQNIIFTPHEMELERLTGMKIGFQNAKEVQNFVNRLGTIVVAKSSETRIFGPNIEPVLLKIGSPAQATGGMGDALAGIIGAFLAQFHQETFEVVAAATYLHSSIAQELAQKAYVVLPSQLIEHLPSVMKSFEQ